MRLVNYKTDSIAACVSAEIQAGLGARPGHAPATHGKAASGRIQHAFAEETLGAIFFAALSRQRTLSTERRTKAITLLRLELTMARRCARRLISLGRAPRLPRLARIERAAAAGRAYDWSSVLKAIRHYAPIAITTYQAWPASNPAEARLRRALIAHERALLSFATTEARSSGLKSLIPVAALVSTRPPARLLSRLARRNK